MSEGNFECKVHNRRESKDGVYITLSINPADLTPDLAMLRVGSALVIGWAEVVDTAIHHMELVLEGANELPTAVTKGKREVQDSAPDHKDRKPFAYQADQAARTDLMRTAVESLVETKIPSRSFSKETVARIEANNPFIQSVKSRRQFSSLPLCQQAAMLSKDPRFWDFIRYRYQTTATCHFDDNSMAGWIRNWCGVTTRTEILKDTKAGRIWEALEQEYQAWLTTNRYADAAR